MVYIGIDLGTTYSSVSMIENEKPIIIFGKDGNFYNRISWWSCECLGNILTPSIVAFSEEGIVTGYSALTCNTEITNVLYGKWNI